MSELEVIIMRIGDVCRKYKMPVPVRGEIPETALLKIAEALEQLDRDLEFYRGIHG